MEYTNQKHFKVIPEPEAAYSLMCGELMERCDFTVGMIRDVLASAPRKVLWD